MNKKILLFLMILTTTQKNIVTSQVPATPPVSDPINQSISESYHYATGQIKLLEEQHKKTIKNMEDAVEDRLNEIRQEVNKMKNDHTQELIQQQEQHQKEVADLQKNLTGAQTKKTSTRTMGPSPENNRLIQDAQRKQKEAEENLAEKELELKALQQKYNAQEHEKELLRLAEQNAHQQEKIRSLQPKTLQEHWQNFKKYLKNLHARFFKTKTIAEQREHGY